MKTLSHDFFQIFSGGGHPTTAKNQNLYFAVLGVATTQKNLKKIMEMCFHKIYWLKKN